MFEFLCGNLTEEEQEQFLSFVERFTSHTCNRNAVRQAARTYRTEKHQGKTTAKPDALIAGSYLANGVKKIVTDDTEHFRTMDITVRTY